MHAEAKKPKTHIHHIVPKHAGGTDDPENLIELTIEDHALAHLDLYYKFGKKEDLTAFYLLNGNLKEGFEELAKLGREKAGQRNKESGHMRRISLALTPEERTIIGKKGAEACRKKQVNAFFDPVLRNEIASLGGKAQGKINAESGHLSEISQNYWNDVKSGKRERKKRIWIYSEELQISKTIEDDAPMPEGFKKGRRVKWKK